MKLRIPLTVFIALALTWTFQEARAGLIRSAGREVSKGAVGVASATENGGQSVVAGAAAAGAAAGAATGTAAKTGAAAVVKGTEAVPVVVAHGAKGAAKKVWKTLW